jgi:hypothetical protein
MANIEGGSRERIDSILVTELSEMVQFAIKELRDHRQSASGGPGVGDASAAMEMF